MLAEIGAFWKALGQQTIGGFIALALPRGLRGAEVNREASVDTEPCMLSRFRPLIPS